MSVLESFSLEGETAIVTGAAQGLGRRMASALAEMGAAVAIADVNREQAERTAAELAEETAATVVATEVDGVFLCAKHVGQQMLERGTGRIVNISSMSGFDVNVPQKQASYNTTKAGVRMLTQSLAVEWADRGVRVNAIAPGYMRTDLVDEVLAANPEMEETWLENTPLGRLGRPEELEELVVYLASDASSFMTGSTVVIDGGYTSR